MTISGLHGTWLRMGLVNSNQREYYRQAMTDGESLQGNGTANPISCMDDVPAVARLAARQEFLTKWYRLLAMIPFGVVAFIESRYFTISYTYSPLSLVLIFTSLAWTGGVLVYTVYLQVTLRCPVCKKRFGIGKKCRSCSLPRHRDSAGLLAKSC